LQVEIEKIAKPISIFFEKVKKLDTALGLDSKKGSWRAAPRKVQWAMQVLKEVKVLRDRISVPIASLNILLQSQVL
jgi:coenzyme F420-reducing hydrogenase delta subunit